MPYRQKEYVSEGHTVKRTRHGYIVVENSTGHKLNFFKNAYIVYRCIFANIPLIK